mmetsp:Transcript_11305/g.69820  ORF Transcript_11305/g.69820 Transcript_11305/m.69820 type:complete len:218 (+) Transcript_11305:4368-5021(+)
MASCSCLYIASAILCLSRLSSAANLAFLAASSASFLRFSISALFFCLTFQPCLFFCCCTLLLSFLVSLACSLSLLHGQPAALLQRELALPDLLLSFPPFFESSHLFLFFGLSSGNCFFFPLLKCLPPFACLFLPGKPCIFCKLGSYFKGPLNFLSCTCRVGAIQLDLLCHFGLFKFFLPQLSFFILGFLSSACQFCSLQSCNLERFLLWALLLPNCL